MSEADAEILLATARVIIRKTAPYLSSTVYGFIPKPSKGMGTMGVTAGMVLYYDPDWLKTLSEEQVAASLVHESMHHLREHLKRGEGMENKMLANVAMDLAINPDIRSSGWSLPHGLFPEQYGFPEGLTTEEYYERLVRAEEEKKEKSQQQQKQQQSAKKEEKEEPANGNSSQGPSGGVSAEKSEQPGQSGKKGQNETGHQPSQVGGSSTTGSQSPGDDKGSSGNSGQEQGVGDDEGSHSHAGGCGSGRCGGIAGNPLSPLEAEMDALYGRSETDRRNIAKKTLQEIQDHVEAHGRGSLAGALSEEFKNHLNEKSKIRWQDELKHVLKKCAGRVEAGGMDFSLSHPSKRSPSRGFPRPGLVQYQPEVCFILDTSGSMGSGQIKEAIKQTLGIFKSVGIDMAWMLQADTVVTDKKRVKVRDLMRDIKIEGRGGTNFNRALEEAEKLRPKPDVIVYLTDGDGAVHFRPKAEVIWCIVPGHWSKKVEVDWGHHIVIKEDGSKA